MANHLTLKEKKKRREELLQFIKGHKKANDFILKEKTIRLKSLNEKDSLKEYENLCKFWQEKGEKDLGDFEKEKILFLIKRRKILDKIGKSLNESKNCKVKINKKHDIFVKRNF